MLVVSSDEKTASKHFDCQGSTVLNWHSARIHKCSITNTDFGQYSRSSMFATNLLDPLMRSAQVTASSSRPRRSNSARACSLSGVGSSSLTKTCGNECSYCHTQRNL
eukprot:6123867-Amphidinium_carterae.1